MNADTQARPDEAAIEAKLAALADLRRAIAVEVVGQNEVVEQLLVALLAGGHRSEERRVGKECS